jgi:hypothetical protein
VIVLLDDQSALGAPGDSQGGEVLLKQHFKGNPGKRTEAN